MSRFLLLSAVLVAQSLAPAAEATLTIRADQPVHPISPILYGLMTEEINHSYDGGLYAELVQNRAFLDDAAKPAHWSPVGGATLALDRTDPVNTTALPVSLRVDLPAEGGGVMNDGYWGIPVVGGRPCTLTFRARATGLTGPLEARLESADGRTVWARADITGVGTAWTTCTATLTPTGPTPGTTEGRLVIAARSGGSLWLSLVSLFPPTHNDRPNGLRPDLMARMRAMKPTFLRLPGGNYLEGHRIADRFPWAATLAPVDQRPGHPGCWRYRSSDGMGLYEMLLWCEDLGVEPLLGVFAGYALKGEVVSDPEGLKPFVQEALDEIEFLIGPETSTWGARRAALGHPKPFPLRYVEIGNEDWFDKSKSYDARYAAFHDAIKARWPHLQLIATMPITSRTPDLVDDHYYASPMGMLGKAARYDGADRKGPRIFVGEWATLEGGFRPPDGGNPTPSLRAALSDAAFLTGLERNSDLVVMAAYAPLLTNVNPGGAQWRTNLIGYDNLRSFGSPSWVVQCCFAEFTGDTVVSSTLVCGRRMPTPAVPAAGRVALVAERGDVSVGGLQGAPGAWTTTGRVESVAGAYALKAQGRLQAGDLATGDVQMQGAVTLGSPEAVLRWSLRDRDHHEQVALLVEAHQARVTFLTPQASGDLGKIALANTVGRAVPVEWSVTGDRLLARVDGRLVYEGAIAMATPPALYAATSRAGQGDVLIKLVNASPEALTMAIDLGGIPALAAQAERVVVTGRPEDRNDVDDPDRIRPVRDVLAISGPHLDLTLAANSLTCLRLHPAP